MSPFHTHVSLGAGGGETDKPYLYRVHRGHGLPCFGLTLLVPVRVWLARADTCDFSLPADHEPHTCCACSPHEIGQTGCVEGGLKGTGLLEHLAPEPAHVRAQELADVVHSGKMMMRQARASVQKGPLAACQVSWKALKSPLPPPTVSQPSEYSLRCLLRPLVATYP